MNYRISLRQITIVSSLLEWEDDFSLASRIVQQDQEKDTLTLILSSDYLLILN